MKYLTIAVIDFLISTYARLYSYPHRSFTQQSCTGLVLCNIHFVYADNHNIELILQPKTHFKRGKK